jgi:hypothetical protein
MKNLKILALALVAVLSSCNNESIENDQNVASPSIEIASNRVEIAKAPGDSESNPIVIGPDKFVDAVYYPFKKCEDGTSTNLQRYRGNFYDAFSSEFFSVVNLAEFDPSKNCVTITNRKAGKDVIEYKYGVYYKIFGQVARLSNDDLLNPERNSDYWVKNTSDPKILAAFQFYPDGRSIFSVNVRNPFLTNPNSICNGVAAFDRKIKYKVSDRIVWRNGLYELKQLPDGRLYWKALGACI